MGRGKFKGKPTGHRHFSTPEEIVKQKNLKAKDLDEEIEKQRAHERYMRLQEQGKTEQARKDLERLTLIRQQRAEAAKKREEEKAAKEQKKAETKK
ncbi:28 kDa heat- and acid-stable phosphoprotein [Linum perenne]